MKCFSHFYLICLQNSAGFKSGHRLEVYVYPHSTSVMKFYMLVHCYMYVISLATSLGVVMAIRVKRTDKYMLRMYIHVANTS